MFPDYSHWPRSFLDRFAFNQSGINMKEVTYYFLQLLRKILDLK